MAKKLKLSPWHDWKTNRPLRKGNYDFKCKCCNNIIHTYWDGKKADDQFLIPKAFRGVLK